MRPVRISSALDEIVAAGERDGLEPRVDAELAEQVADVGADRLRGKMQLVRDLFRRAPLFEEAQHFVLARREARMRWSRWYFTDVLDLSEDANHVVAILERNGAQVHLDAFSIRRHDDGAAVGASWWSV